MNLNPDALADLYQVVLSLEWEAYEEAEGTTLMMCPLCGQYKSEGHAPDCALQNALHKAEGK